MYVIQQLKESKHSIKAVFFDDGGVLNDNRLRGPEYRKLIGRFMAERLGESAERWALANEKVFPHLWSDLQNQITDFSNHREYQREFELLWIHRMCSLVSITVPPDDIATSVARSALVYAGQHAQTEIKGAANSVWKLFNANYLLYAASGTPSWELNVIFSRMGIRQVFSGLYGPDLVDCVKYGTRFYDQIFKEAGILPEECLVIESSKKCCACLLYTSPSPRDQRGSRMPSSA